MRIPKGEERLSGIVQKSWAKRGKAREIRFDLVHIIKCEFSHFHNFTMKSLMQGRERNKSGNTLPCFKLVLYVLSKKVLSKFRLTTL